MAKKRRKKNKYGLIPGSRRGGFVIPQEELNTVIANERHKYLTAKPWERSHFYYMTILIAHGLGIRGTDAVNLTWAQCIDLENKGELILEESKKKHLKGTRRYSLQRLPRIHAYTRLMREAYNNLHQYKKGSRKVFSNLSDDYYKSTVGRGHTRFKDGIVTVDILEDWYVRVMKRNKVFVEGRMGGHPFWSCARVTWGRMQYDALIKVEGLNGRKLYSPNQAIAHLQAMFNHATPQMTRHYLRLGSHDEQVVSVLNDSFKVNEILSSYSPDRAYNPGHGRDRNSSISKGKLESIRKSKDQDNNTDEDIVSIDDNVDPDIAPQARSESSIINDFDFDLSDEIGNVSTSA